MLVASVFKDLADEVGNYAECAQAAQTQAERDECERRFRDEVDQQQ